MTQCTDTLVCTPTPLQQGEKLNHWKLVKTRFLAAVRFSLYLYGDFVNVYMGLSNSQDFYNMHMIHNSKGFAE